MATDTAADAEASTATANNNTITADNVCPICTQPFTDPRLQLPGCSHTFCGACLASWLDTSIPQATCPMCRCVIEDPSGLFASVGMRRHDRQKPLPGSVAVPGSDSTQLIYLAAVPADGTSSSCSSPESVPPSCTQVIQPASGGTQDVVAPLLSGASSQGVTAFATALTGAWRFHSRHGQDITVSHRGQTVSWAGTGKGTIVTSEHLTVEQMYEVQLDQAVHGHSGSVQGNEAPGLPGDTALESVTDGWDCDVVFHHDVYERGRAGPVAALGRKLIHLPARSRFGVMVSSGRSLHLYCDGGLVTSCSLSSTPSPYFVVFELRIKYT